MSVETKSLFYLLFYTFYEGKQLGVNLLILIPIPKSLIQYLLMFDNISFKLGVTKSTIGFGYNPKNNKKAIITTSVIASLVVTSAKTLVLVSPNIVFWNIFSI